MGIGFTEEQELLRASARKFLENECPSAFERKQAAAGSAMSRCWPPLFSARNMAGGLHWRARSTGRPWRQASEVAFGGAIWHRERVAWLITA